MSASPREIVALVGSLVLLAGCGGDPALSSARVAEVETPPPASLASRTLDPPAAPGALAPEVTTDGETVRLSWLEPVDGGNRLRTAMLEPGATAWSPAHTVIETPDAFANWADRPAVVRGGDGTEVAHWLGKLGDDTYAYGVHLLARKGSEWVEQGLLHDDESPAEHGFVSWLPTDDGLRAFWLDGRATVGESPGPMQLRTTMVVAGRPGPSTLLDERVCDCCVLDSALTPSGAVVVYRNRDEGEIRDISVVRQQGAGWSEPALLAVDGWVIPGCPVNGPAIAVDDNHLAVVWFTAANDRAAVRLAFSRDDGATWTAPIDVDLDHPLGRLDLVLADGDAYVGWLDAADDTAVYRVQRFSPDGASGPVRDLVTTTPSRRSGVPRLVRRQDDLMLVWVEDSEESRLRAALVPIASVSGG